MRIEGAEHAVDGGVLHVLQLVVVLQVLLDEGEDVLELEAQLPQIAHVGEIEGGFGGVDAHRDSRRDPLAVIGYLDEQLGDGPLHLFHGRPDHLALVDARGIDVVLLDVDHRAVEDRELAQVVAGALLGAGFGFLRAELQAPARIAVAIRNAQVERPDEGDERERRFDDGVHLISRWGATAQPAIAECMRLIRMGPTGASAAVFRGRSQGTRGLTIRARAA